MTHMPAKPGDPEQVIVDGPDNPGDPLPTMADVYAEGREYGKAMWAEIDARIAADPDRPLHEVVDEFKREMTEWDRATGNAKDAEPAWDNTTDGEGADL